MLAQAYLGTGDIAAAQKALEEGGRVEAMFPWEPPQRERVRTALQKRLEEGK